MIRAILFDFLGTLVSYSPSRTEQGYEETYALLRSRYPNLSYASFLEHWVAAFEELDSWSQAEELQFA